MSRRRGGVPAAHVLRQAWSAPGLLVLMLVVVAVVAAMASVTPRLLDRAATDEVRTAVGPAAEPRARTLVVALPLEDDRGERALRDDTATAATAAGVRVRTTVPDQLAAVLGPAVVSVTSAELRAGVVGTTPVLLRFAFLAAAPTVDATAVDVAATPGALTWLEGAAPAAPVLPPGVDESNVPPLPVDVALSEATATYLDLHAGDHLEADDGSGTLVDVVVSGVFRPTDANAPVWQPLPTAVEPLVVGGSVPRADVVALTSAGSVAAARLAVGGARMTQAVRFDVVPAALDASTAGTVAKAVAAVVASPSTLGFGGVSPSVQTGVDRALGAALVRVASVRAQATTVLSGGLALGLLVLALTAGLLVRRRAPVLAHQRTVGASLPAVARALAAESLAVVLVAGGIGVGVGLLAVPGAVAWTWVGPTLLLASVVGPAVGTVVAAGTTAPPPARALVQRNRAVELRRPLAEAALVLLAAAALGTLRLRGATASGSSLAADLVVLAAPVLVAGAAAVALVRVLPFVVGRVRGSATRGRGAVRLVAVARRSSTAGPVASLVLASALVTLSGSLLATVAAGRQAGSWFRVGGDAVLSASPDTGLPDLTDLAAAPGVTASAQARVVPGVQVLGTGVDQSVRLVAVDPAELQRLLAATPLPDAPALAALDGAAEPGTDALPALVAGLPDGTTTATLHWRRDAVPIVVVGVAPWLPVDQDGPPADATVVVARSALADAVDAPVPATLAWLAGPGVAAALDGHGPGPTVDVLTRDGWLDALRSSPTTSAFHGVLVGVLALVSGLGLLVVALTASAAGPDRERAAVALRVIGFARRSTARLAVLELAQVVLPAVLVGALTGAGIAAAVTGPLDLAGLTGLATTPALVVPWWAWAAAAALAATTWPAASAAHRGRHRERLGEVLRAG